MMRLAIAALVFALGCSDKGVSFDPKAVDAIVKSSMTCKDAACFAKAQSELRALEGAMWKAGGPPDQTKAASDVIEAASKAIDANQKANAPAH